MNGATRFEYATARRPRVELLPVGLSAAVAPAEDNSARSICCCSLSTTPTSTRGLLTSSRRSVTASAISARCSASKFLADRLAWEFYFYDYARREREVSISRVLTAIRPFVRCDVPINENLPYFMFSLDLDSDLASGRRPLDVVHMYVGNPGSAVSSGIAYAVRAGRTTLENFYFFFDGRSSARRGRRQDPQFRLFRRDASVRRRGAGAGVARLPHDLRGQQANTRLHLLLRRRRRPAAASSLPDLTIPDPSSSLSAAIRHNFDHLLFDVGFDYRMEDGALSRAEERLLRRFLSADKSAADRQGSGDGARVNLGKHGAGRGEDALR